MNKEQLEKLGALIDRLDDMATLLEEGEKYPHESQVYRDIHDISLQLHRLYMAVTLDRMT